MATNSTPIKIETGFSQLDHGSPAALPTGTRPDAIAPTTVPMKNGVITDEAANRCSAKLRSLGRFTTSWKANPEPRRTIPSAARHSGMNRVDITASKATEKAVHNTTRMKISQTWLASHTGPIAESISRRARSAALAAAADQRPEPRAEVGAAEDGVQGRPGPEDRRGDVRLAHARSSSGSERGPYGTATA